MEAGVHADEGFRYQSQNLIYYLRWRKQYVNFTKNSNIGITFLILFIVQPIVLLDKSHVICWDLHVHKKKAWK